VIELFGGPTTPFGAIHGPLTLAETAITSFAGALTFDATTSTSTFLTATGVKQNNKNQSEEHEKRDHY
jgi:hypothetical protein